MITALQAFEQELTKDTSENTENLPSFLVHRLEHYYSEHSLNVQSLKGTDANEVRCLAEVCSAAGFQIYLAALAKQVSEEQAKPEEECHREETISHVACLNGEKTNTKPIYHHRSLLKEIEEDEEHLFGTERDEYTSNKGAMARWRYKASIVLLVPPSRKLEFSMSHATKMTCALEILSSLRSDARKYPDLKSKLHDLCLVVLRLPKPQGWWKWRTHAAYENELGDRPSSEDDSDDAKLRRSCVSEVVAASLEND